MDLSSDLSLESGLVNFNRESPIPIMKKLGGIEHLKIKLGGANDDPNTALQYLNGTVSSSAYKTCGLSPSMPHQSPSIPKMGANFEISMSSKGGETKNEDNKRDALTTLTSIGKTMSGHAAIQNIMNIQDRNTPSSMLEQHSKDTV